MFSGCTELTSIVLPKSVTSIGDEAFAGCTKLKSIIIPENVISIGKGAFDGCTALSNVIIPKKVASIGSQAFRNCTGLHSVTIPNSVTSIGIQAFEGCTGLTSITIPNSVTSIGNNAFAGCSNLKSVLINNNEIMSKSYSLSSNLSNIFGSQVHDYSIGNEVSSIGNYAFYGCNGMTSVTIDNSVSSIGSYAFYGCSGLTSIEIPKSVSNIGNYAFAGCTGLSSVTINSNDIVSKYYTPSSNISKIFGSQVKEYIIGEGITAIGSNAFYNCYNISSIKFPNSLTSVNYDAFYGCSSLTAITIPSGVTSINEAFSNCGGLSSIVVDSGNTVYDSRENCNALIKTSSNSLILGCKNTIIPSSVTYIANCAFSGCTGLTSITLPSSVTTIGVSAFDACSRLSSIIIPEKVTYIGDKAFNNCSNLETAVLPDKLANIFRSSFPNNTKLNVNVGSLTLLNLWKNSYENIYEIGSENKLPAPYLTSISTTQSKIKTKINNKYKDYSYVYGNKTINDDTFIVEGLRPESSYTISVDISKYGTTYTTSVSAKTQGLYPSANGGALSASSINVSGRYSTGDAKIIKHELSCNGKKVEGTNTSFCGLKPNTSYKVIYTITVAYGENDKFTTTYTKECTVKTSELTMTTEQPKVVSVGNVIVSAKANVDDAETNVGFEWRRTDWTDDFKSNTGTAYMYEGTMEGYIRNLYAEKLWKFRPYYLADDGTYYYGDWMGIDPTNTSYFEPTVHTYANINVEGNTALVKGYALGGTDKITVQGFKYWKAANLAPSGDLALEARKASPAIPADAQTIEAEGRVMEATLSGLDYECTYSYVAFAKTDEGTFYGEVKTFTTGPNTTGIEVVHDADSETKAVDDKVKGIYTLTGVKLSDDAAELKTMKRGIYIVNGRKVAVK